MLHILVNALAPIFVGLLLGYLAGLRNVVDNRNVAGLIITFLMTFALPCSLFIAIALTPRAQLWGQAKGASVLAIVYVAVFVATHFALQDSAANRAVLGLTIGFPNAAAVGIPLLQAVYGPQATVTVAVGLAIGAITITPVTLAILENGTAQGKTLSHAPRVGTSVWRAVKNPIFWAPVAVALAVAVDYQMPAFLNKSLTILGNATEGAALFVTGLIASAQRFNLDTGVGLAVLGKNVIQPALCVAVVLVLGMPMEQIRPLALLSACPCGFFGILFGEGLGPIPQIASSSLIASTLASSFTLAGWIVLLEAAAERGLR